MMLRFARMVIRLILIGFSYIDRILQMVPGRQKVCLLPTTSTKEGISVIIPERDSPDLLAICLPSLIRALEKVDTQCEVIIIVNASTQQHYHRLQDKFENIQWYFISKPLNFSQAIEAGLSVANYSWVYLLNNDMRLTENTLAELWHWRSTSIFGLASQVFFEDESRRREETGFTGFNMDFGIQGLYDRLPEHAEWPALHLYAGGGASLFQRDVLSQFIAESNVYSPFYWEDVEWGLRAQQQGLEVLFVPRSIVFHRHRATVSRFFSKEDISAMFQRNAMQCMLRNFTVERSSNNLDILIHYRYQLLSGKNLLRALKSRWRWSRTTFKPAHFGDDIASLYPHHYNENIEKPWLLWVVPFSISPVSHGGARRVVALSYHLAKYFRLALLSDEGWSYHPDHMDNLTHFHRIHLLKKPRPEMGNSRQQRIKSHSRNFLAKHLNILVSKLQPAVVQIEHEELCDLIPGKKGNASWFLTLHDVNHGQPSIDRWINHRLQRFDRVISCSPDDAGLLPAGMSVLIENGTDIPNLDLYRPSEGYHLLFLGPFRYRQNVDGICHFVEHCFDALKIRFPQLQLTILAGKGGVEIAAKIDCLKREGIEVLGHTDKVTNYLNDATFTINPLPEIRGSCIKTLESLANGRVCVSSKTAARGLDHFNFAGLQLLETPTEWHDTICRLLLDEPYRHHIESPQSNILESFDWRRRAEQYRSLYAEFGVAV